MLTGIEVGVPETLEIGPPVELAEEERVTGTKVALLDGVDTALTLAELEEVTVVFCAETSPTRTSTRNAREMKYKTIF
jgi:hypothetical protein